MGWNACTFWIDRLLWWDWHACCVRHDLDYASLVPKALADERLKLCVDAILPGMGDVMWFGVAVFGGLWYAMAQAKRRAQP